MPDPLSISNWRRLDKRLTTSGQPTEDQLCELAALGVTDVINLGLHTHKQALPDEASSLRRLGIAYIHIPVDFARPTEQDFAHFCAAMDTVGERRVHVHCIANMRVSAFLYRWQRDVRGASSEQARALMDSLWRPGNVWAAFIGDETAISLPHRPPA